MCEENWKAMCHVHEVMQLFAALVGLNPLQRLFLHGVLRFSRVQDVTCLSSGYTGHTHRPPLIVELRQWMDGHSHHFTSLCSGLSHEIPIIAVCDNRLYKLPYWSWCEWTLKINYFKKSFFTLFCFPDQLSIKLMATSLSFIRSILLLLSAFHHHRWTQT